MSQLIEQRFKKVGEGRYVYIKRQLIYTIIGGTGVIILFYFIFESLHEINFQFHLGYCLVGLFGCFTAFFLIAIGFYTVVSEIDLTKRVVRITRRTIWGRKSFSEFPLDHIQVNALRIGVTDANPHDVWIVTAGFSGETEDYDRFNIAIFSKETESIDERNRIMLELYHFFFPDRRTVGLGNIITDGTRAGILTDAQKTTLENDNAMTFDKKDDKV